MRHAPLPPNAIVITVDDGYRDAFDIALPLLNSFGFPATLFAVADFVDSKCWVWTDIARFILLSSKRSSLAAEFENGLRIVGKLGQPKERIELADRLNSVLKQLRNAERAVHLKHISDRLEVDVPALPPQEYAPITWEQAQEMETHDFQIESHTMTHPILTGVDRFELDFELRRSKERLEKALGKTVKHFCYPNGNFNERVKQLVEAVGYQSAVTTDYGFNDNHSDRFSLKRIGGTSAVASFAQSVSGFEAAKISMMRAKKTA